MQKPKLLNLGCGGVYDARWVNIDLNKTDKNILYADLKNGIPFEDNYFNVVYCSHLLEHMDSKTGQELVNEVYRVLKPRGIFRVLVPDLESISKEYLINLRKASKNRKYMFNYQWIKLEMFDQVVREYSGGEMRLYLNQRNLPNKKYILSRIGPDSEEYFNKSVGIKNKIINYIVYLKNKDIGWYINKIRYILLTTLIYVFGGKSYLNSFRSGVFRNSGEIHKCMYDKLSLSVLLKSVGFKRIKVVSPFISQIMDFHKYKLDVVDGIVRKPDSLFMEAEK